MVVIEIGLLAQSAQWPVASIANAQNILKLSATSNGKVHEKSARQRKN
jgi:hypothetical protein